MLKRIFTLENIPLIIAFVVSLFVTLLEVFGRFDATRIPTVILFCIAVLIIGLLVERTVYFERLERAIANSRSPSGVKGIYGVYFDRNNLPPYQQYIRDAGEQVIVISISLGETSTRYLDYLSKIAERRIPVRLVALDPDSSGVASVAKLRGISAQNLESQIRTSLDLIVQYRSQLPPWQMQYIQLRVYDWSPTWGGIAVDPGSASGKMLIDSFQYGAAIGTWPELELRPNLGDGVLFEFYSRQFLRIWTDAAEWPKGRN